MKVEKLSLDDNETKDIKNFYSKVAEKTADEWYKIDILIPTIEEFLSLLPDRPRVLDLGCGPGYESMRLEARGAQVIGIDFCEENIRIAQDRCPQCRFEIMDFRELDSRFGSFDGIFANASLIHVNPNELNNVMHKISGIINKNGHLLITVRDGEGIMDGGKALEDGTQLRRKIYLHSQTEITEVADKYGLKFLKEGYLDRELQNYNWKCYIFKKE